MSINVLSTPPVTITSPFGKRTLAGKTIMHNGIDLIGPGGLENIIAAANGTVIEAVLNVPDSHSGLGVTSQFEGNYVKIKHNDVFTTIYMHMKAGSVTVKSGDIIKSGAKIGVMGKTGYTTGVHLHFGILKNGKYVDPALYLSGKLTFAISPPTPKSNPYKEPTVLVHKGDTGNSVKWVQWQLVNLGAKLDIDGIFGTLTYNAVIAFQKARKLHADGIVGPNTKNELRK